MPTSTPFADLSFRGQVGRLRQLGRVALAEYDLDTSDSRLVLLAHMDNTTFHLDTRDGNRYLLRIHRVTSSPSQTRRTVGNVRSEMQWLLALRAETDLRVPLPMLTRDGDSCVVADFPGVPEPRICVLLGWVDGRFVYERLTGWHLERVGRFTARMHEFTAAWDVPPRFDRWRVGDLTEDIAGSVLALSAATCGSADVALVDRTIQLAQATLRRIDDQLGMAGLIHGDLHSDNYLFHNGVIGAIDFDDCGWGRYLYDLAVTLADVRFRPDYPALREALLRGYQQLRPLPGDDERQLEALVGWRIVVLMVWLLEHRDHPGFVGWEPTVRYLLGRLPGVLDSA